MVLRVPSMLCSLILLAGGLVLLFFLVLAGVKNTTPLNQIWFLEADTSGIPNAPRPLTHWTFYNSCPVDANGLNNCGGTTAGYPFSPVDNFGTTRGVAPNFIDDAMTYSSLSKAGFALHIVALVFGAIAFLVAFAGICLHLGAISVSSCTFLATFFMLAAASITTAWVVMGRNTFQANNQFAAIGVKAIAFSWATVAAFFLASVLMCFGGIGSKKDRHTTSSGRRGRFFSRRRRTTIRESKV